MSRRDVVERTVERAVGEEVDRSGTRHEVLAALRHARGFDAEAVLAAKVGRVGRWFDEQGLDAAVVGVSGGIDSAVALGLLARTAAAPGSPLRRIVALLVPIEADGATGQDRALERGRLVAERLSVEHWIAPFGAVQDAAATALARASGLDVDAWAAGQLLSVVRTPALYGAAALLQAHGSRSVVVGTTNRDEGAYVGFFGKASDAMVDLQPLSDLHKSEVRALAAVLGVPQVVIDAAPSGDVWDGRTDLDMIGADYDDVELVLRLREVGIPVDALASTLTDGDGLRRAAAAVEARHAVNAHKYRVGSPAVHLDVLPRGVPGGWADEALSPRDHPRPAGGVGPGEWVPGPVALDPPTGLPSRLDLLDTARADGDTDAQAHAVAAGQPVAFLARTVLAPADCQRLIQAMARGSEPAPVGITGVCGSAGVGSMRATAWSPELAAALWARLRAVVPSVRFLDPRTPTDGHATVGRSGHRTWRAAGLSPVLRFMRYEAGGRHLTHFDAGYDYGDGRRTLLSVVLYLTGAGDLDAGSGGATRLVRDGQEHLPVWARDHDDWDRDTDPDEVLVAVRPEQGAALVFDHRIGHDVEQWDGPGARVVIRADVIYEAVPDGRSLP
jgi:NAD+ synthetase